MPNWVNFAEIRKRVSIEDVLLRYYHLENFTRDGKKLIGPCPVHNGDSPRAFHADLDKNVWHCFSKCQGGGNQLDLVAKKEDIGIREATLKLQAYFLEGEKRLEKPAPPPSMAATKALREAISSKEKDDETAVLENPPLDIKLDLKPDHPHLLTERSLKVEAAQHFGVGYCSRGILRGMIAIPIQDDDGNLIAYAGRRLKPQDIREHGKYKLPKGFKKELVLYNLNRAKEYQKEHGLILVEGFFSVLKLYEAGFPNVVASMGCELSEQQVQLLVEAKEVFIFFDGNDAGYAGAEKAKQKLSTLVPARVVKLEENTEPEDLSPSALRWIIKGMSRLDIVELTFQRRRLPADASAMSAASA